MTSRVKYLWWIDVERPFWEENSYWPYTHSVVFMSVYFMLESFPYTMIAMFAWEVVERALAHAKQTKRVAKENWDDSWFGDPLVGTTAIGIFAIVDFLLHYTYQVTYVSPPFFVRTVATLVQVVPVFCFPHEANESTRSIRVYIIPHVLVYVGVEWLVYAWWLESSVDSIRLVAWTIGALGSALVSLSSCTRVSSFKRIFFWHMLILVMVLSMTISILTIE